MPASTWDITAEGLIDKALYFKDTYYIALLNSNTGSKTIPKEILLQSELSGLANYTTRPSFTIAEDPVYNSTNDWANFPSAPFVLEVVNSSTTLTLQFQQVLLIKGGRGNAPKEIAVSSISNSTLTLAGHNFQAGDKVAVKADVGGTLPTPLTTNILYTLVNVSGNNFRLSTDGIAPLTLSGGVGDFFVIDCTGKAILFDSFPTVETIPASSGHSFTFDFLTLEEEV